MENENTQTQESSQDSRATYSMEALYSELHKNRIVFLFDDINSETVCSTIVQLFTLESRSKDSPIWLFINSTGGSVLDGFALIDVIRKMESPVYTVCVGMAASMAACVFAAGERKHRYTLPSSRFLLHQPSGGSEGQISDISNHAKELERIKDVYLGLLAELTGKSVAKLRRDCDRDFSLDAPQAIKYGLADSILAKLPL